MLFYTYEYQNEQETDIFIEFRKLVRKTQKKLAVAVGRALCACIRAPTRVSSKGRSLHFRQKKIQTEHTHQYV